MERIISRVCKAVDREISYREALELLADYANHDNRGWEAVFAMMGIAQKALDLVHDTQSLCAQGPVDVDMPINMDDRFQR